MKKTERQSGIIYLIKERKWISAQEIADTYFLPTIQLTDEELNLLMSALMAGKEIQVPGSHMTYEMLSL